MASTTGPRGAFGLALTGLLAEHPALGPAPRGWPRWSWAWRPDLPAGAGDAPEQDLRRVLDRDAPDAGPGSHLLINRLARSITLAAPDRPGEPALLHPWLTAVAGMLAHEAGHDTWHAGGVVVAGRLWAVLGARESGKSTLLAAWQRRGLLSSADDLVVVHQGTALNGPATVDLREPAARALDAGERVELLPGRVRWRVTGPPPPAELPFAGFVLPQWGDPGICPVPAAERLRLLLQHSYTSPLTGRELRLLELTALPMLAWTRPRDLTRVQESVDTLHAALGRA